MLPRDAAIDYVLERTIAQLAVVQAAGFSTSGNEKSMQTQPRQLVEDGLDRSRVRIVEGSFGHHADPKRFELDAPSGNIRVVAGKVPAPAAAVGEPPQRDALMVLRVDGRGELPQYRRRLRHVRPRSHDGEDQVERDRETEQRGGGLVNTRRSALMA